MAAIKQLDLKTQLFSSSSGKFHNRGSGKLFRSTYHSNLYSKDSEHDLSANSSNRSHDDSSTNGLDLIVHPDFTDNEGISTSTPRSVPNYCRRTQSAKARTRLKPQISGRREKCRPASAGNIRQGGRAAVCSDKPVAVIDLVDKVIPELSDIDRERLLALPDPKDFNNLHELPPMHFSRPSSAKYDMVYADNDDQSLSKRKKKVRKQENDLKPSIYGLQRNRHFYGSAPDLTSTDSNLEQFPYKCSDECVDKTDNGPTQSDKRTTPATLDPLLPWLQHNIPDGALGVDPSQCLVFLTPVDWEALPEVPDELGAEEDLPYVRDITSPKPWNKQPVEEWVCQHGQTPVPPGEGNVIYRHTVNMPRMRTADVVRKEITELENLMKGVGRQESECGMVQYQSEIAAFKQALQDTLELVPERLKNPPEPVDTFGMKKIFTDHDSAIQGIEARVNECRAELADLELEAGISTARRHFTRPRSAIN
ncbi:hypothetical protein MAR_028005 [Mya arenaria]|uniref:Uncharacterized protein n=1 Tax=Mya arenaria TaxID=6604 RepID=A0ABY7DJY2_MYAAR|nr:hypothetical protein MAR_028005 [Mya arenaria]